MKRKHVISLVFASMIFIWLTWFSSDISGLSEQGKAALGVALFAIIIWMTGAVEDALSGILVIFLLTIAKVMPVSGALSGYANSALWLLVIGFIMAACMEKSGLSKRIALVLVNWSNGSVYRIYWAIALVILVLTFLVPSITARVLLMLPIILGISQALHCKKMQSNITKAMLFIVAMSGTMMSAAVLTAHAANPITAGLIELSTGETISWSGWFKVAGPPALLLAALSVFVISIMWKPEITDSRHATHYIQQELAQLGNISRHEKYTLAIFILTLLFWATDSIHKVPVVVVGFMSVILLLWPGVGALNWKEAQNKIPWSVFILYGAGLSLGAALVSSGAAKWLADAVLSPITHYQSSTQLVIIIWGITLLQLFFTGGGPKTTALTPIIIAFAISTGQDPVILALIVGMNMVHQYILPVSNMPNIVIMGTHQLTTAEMVKTGVVMSLLATSFMSLMVFTYWQWTGIL